jgi:predicted  nucleic acid-binding Zn-ribbon protein
METHIDNLVKLQAVELERAGLNQALRALPGEVALAESALAAAQGKSADISSALSREDSLRTRLEREIAGHRQKAARFRTQLDTVKTPEQAEAIEHEIRFETAEADRLEEEEYASLERSEAQEPMLAAAREQVESLAEALEKTQARIELRRREFAAQLASLDVERESLRKLIAPEWLSRFDRLCASRGTGIVPAENQQCTGCRMGLRPQAWNELREGQLIACDSCQRLLYWDPAMAPAPKAPQPEAIPGAGRAVRRPRSAGA